MHLHGGGVRVQHTEQGTRDAHHLPPHPRPRRQVKHLIHQPEDVVLRAPHLDQTHDALRRPRVLRQGLAAILPATPTAASAPSTATPTQVALASMRRAATVLRTAVILTAAAARLPARSPTLFVAAALLAARKLDAPARGGRRPPRTAAAATWRAADAVAGRDAAPRAGRVTAAIPAAAGAGALVQDAASGARCQERTHLFAPLQRGVCQHRAQPRIQCHAPLLHKRVVVVVCQQERLLGRELGGEARHRLLQQRVQVVELGVAQLQRPAVIPRRHIHLVPHHRGRLVHARHRPRHLRRHHRRPCCHLRRLRCRGCCCCCRRCAATTAATAATVCRRTAMWCGGSNTQPKR